MQDKKRKSARKARHPSSEDDSEVEQRLAEAKKASTWRTSLGDDSLSSPAPSDKEEGELSEDEGQGITTFTKADRLCPSELYPRVLLKSAKMIDLSVPLVPPQVTTPLSRAKTYPQGPPKPQPVPFAEALERVLTVEWETITQPKSHRVIDKFYTLPEPIMKSLKTLTVNAPVAAVSSATILPSEGESGPKDICDKRVEAALKRNFELFLSGL